MVDLGLGLLLYLGSRCWVCFFDSFVYKFLFCYFRCVVLFAEVGVGLDYRFVGCGYY